MYTTMQSAMAGGEQVLKLLDTIPDVQDQDGSVAMPSMVVVWILLMFHFPIGLNYQKCFIMSA